MGHRFKIVLGFVALVAMILMAMWHSVTPDPCLGFNTFHKIRYELADGDTGVVSVPLCDCVGKTVQVKPRICVER